MERDLRAEGFGPEDCYPDGTDRSKGVSLRFIRQSDIEIGRFYGVSTYTELVDAQARHIEKLQEKLRAFHPVDAGRPNMTRA